LFKCCQNIIFLCRFQSEVNRQKYQFRITIWGKRTVYSNIAYFTGLNEFCLVYVLCGLIKWFDDPFYGWSPMDCILHMNNSPGTIVPFYHPFDPKRSLKALTVYITSTIYMYNDSFLCRHTNWQAKKTGKHRCLFTFHVSVVNEPLSL
jgi:hypothetical protein